MDWFSPVDWVAVAIFGGGAVFVLGGIARDLWLHWHDDE